MTSIRPATRSHVSAIEDSRRWKEFQHRPTDIIVSTPPKSGTTWTQGIVASLLEPDGAAQGEMLSRTRWIDARFNPTEVVLAELDAQTHRRSIKTHSPADCVPVFEACKYIVVYRDGRDALMSWANHRSKMRPEVMDMLNESATAEGIDAMPRAWDGTLDTLFDEWASGQSSITHLASWWPMRDKPFVHFLHYNDLSADLDGEIRRLARYLAVDITEAQWPAVVERCRIDRMRDDAHESGRANLAFEGGADSFFFKGTNGRWRGVMTAAQLDRYDQLVAQLPNEAATWLEHGSLVGGSRPGE